MSEHKPTTAKEHEEWKRLDKAATPTPWDGIVSAYAVRHDYPAKDGMHGDNVCTVYRDVDKELIAMMRNNFRRLIEEVEYLRPIVVRLNPPKTADGVTVIPGIDRVWKISRDTVLGYLYTSRDLLVYNNSSNKFYIDVSDVHRCYSTKEAAEEAIKKGTAEEAEE